MEKKCYYFYFSGYCQIKAKSEEEAEELFWQKVDSTGNTVVEIDSVEEV